MRHEKRPGHKPGRDRSVTPRLTLAPPTVSVKGREAWRAAAARPRSAPMPETPTAYRRKSVAPRSVPAAGPPRRRCSRRRPGPRAVLRIDPPSLSRRLAAGWFRTRDRLFGVPRPENTLAKNTASLGRSHLAGWVGPSADDNELWSRNAAVHPLGWTEKRYSSGSRSATVGFSHECGWRPRRTR